MRKKIKMKKRAKRKSKSGFGKFFLLDWKRAIGVIALWIFAIAAHNAIFGFYMIEEPFFFTLAVIAIPAYLIISIIYTLILCKHKR